MGFNFSFILTSIMSLLDIVMNFTIKILVIYTMYLLICSLKKYLNDK